MEHHHFIREIIVKECERYELLTLGFVSDIEKITEWVLRTWPITPEVTKSEDTFYRWKEQVCTAMYSNFNYPAWFRKKKKSTTFRLFVRQLLSNIVSTIRRHNTAKTVDDELKVRPPYTISYKISTAIFAGFFQPMISEERLISSPIQLENLFHKMARNTYPISYTGFIDRLKANDQEFWTETSTLINRLVKQVVYLNSYINPTRYDETCEMVSTQTTLRLQEKLDYYAGLQSATHMKYSLLQVGKWKLHEHLNKEKQTEVLLEDNEWNMLEEAEEADTTPVALPLAEVDIRNRRELSCALLSILNQGCGKEWELLVGRDATKVDIFAKQTLLGMSYDDICLSIYGQLPDDERERECINLRKTVSRTRVWLAERIKLLVLYAQGDAQALKKLTREA